MARGRMISNTLGSSERLFRLYDLAGDLAEFAMLLFPLMVPHADDFGRLLVDAFTAKMRYFPVSGRSIADFQRALDALCLDASADSPAPDDQRAIDRLIVRYRSDAGTIGQIVNFEPHQMGLHKRTRSNYPPPPGWSSDGDRFEASEADIEAYVAASLGDGSLTVLGSDGEPLQIASVTRQARYGACYLDIVAQTVLGPTVIIEVKRHPVSEAAVAQVTKYADLIGGPTVPIVIGYGIATNLRPSDLTVAVGVYGEDLRITAMPTASAFALLHVPEHSRTFPNVPSEEKRTEEKRTEEKGRELKKRSAGADRRTQAVALVALYHEICAGLPKVTSLTPKRISHACARLAERPLEGVAGSWRDVFERTARSPFLTGKVPPAPGRAAAFVASFDWLTRSADESVQILEGKYDARPTGQRPPSSIRQATRDRHAAQPVPKVNLA